MSTAELGGDLAYEAKNTAETMIVEGVCKFTDVVFHCHIALIREEDGSVSALVLNLPGVGSCGETEEKAVENVREAVRGMVESYEATDSPIPWKDPLSEDIPEGAKLKWILVHV